MCYYGDRPELLQILLAAGADVNRHLDSGMTPLHMAANLGRVKCVELLIKVGAKVDAERGIGRRPAEDLSDSPLSHRVLAILLRAGSPIPRLFPEGPGASGWLCNGETPYNEQRYQVLCHYRAKVVAAGSWVAYEKAHSARLTRVFVPKFPRVPAEVVSIIVAFGFHTGWY